MRKSAHTPSRLWRRLSWRLTAIMVLAAAGSVFVMQSMAASHVWQGEAESGAIAGKSAAYDVVSASGGKAVRFGTGSSDGRLGSRVTFGAYTTGPSGDYWVPSDIRRLETKLGHKVSPVQYYSDFSTPFRLADCQDLAKDGHDMLIGWEPNMETQQIISGKADAYIKQFAADVAKCPAQVYIRPYLEMNGSFMWYSPYHDQDYPGDPLSTHTASPAQLVTSYRHIVTTFRSVNPKVKWVFCPNQTDEPAIPANRMEQYYPGDAYTDILAFDAYNWGNGGPFGSWQPAKEVYRDAYTRLTALNAHMPVWVAETSSKEPLVNDGYGTNPGLSKGQWITDLFNMAEHPRIDTIVWFDLDKQTDPPMGAERDWRVDSSADSLQALKKALTMNP